MSSAEKTSSIEQYTATAIDILRRNDRQNARGEHFTVPADRLYPHQWNWDSAFVALGWLGVDETRAWQELGTLIAAQWPNGMVPHIIYHNASETYFPDSARWRGVPTGNSSGFTQNPVLASCTRWLLEQATDHATAVKAARALLPAIDRWHRWFFKERRDPETGAIAIAHPWESRDNACDWDAPLAAVDTNDVLAYTRKDLLLVDSDQRPTPQQYQQFLAIVEAGKRAKWQCTAQNMPFWVADPFITAILITAERDLIALSETLAQPAIAAAARLRQTRLADGLEALWRPQSSSYRAYDIRARRFSEADDIGTLLPLYSGVTSDARAATLIAKLERWLRVVQFGVPSHDPESPLFESQRYWRGPIWLVVNLMIAYGLRRYGRDDLADRLAQDGHRLIRANGFRESFDPLHGTGSGGDTFSWTAAMWLYWLRTATIPSA